jgi:hypothetical protein
MLVNSSAKMSPYLGYSLFGKTRLNGATTFSIMAFSIMTLSNVSLRVMTFSIMTFISYAECRYAECRLCLASQLSPLC